MGKWYSRKGRGAAARADICSRRSLVVRHEIEAAITAGVDAVEGLIVQGESKRQADARIAVVAVVAPIVGARHDSAAYLAYHVTVQPPGRPQEVMRRTDGPSPSEELVPSSRCPRARGINWIARKRRKRKNAPQPKTHQMLVLVRLFILINWDFRNCTAVFRKNAEPRRNRNAFMGCQTYPASSLQYRPVPLRPALPHILLRKLPGKVLEKFRIFLERPNYAGTRILGEREAACSCRLADNTFASEPQITHRQLGVELVNCQLSG